MPQNKYALIRYRTINRKLLGGNVVSKQELIEAIEETLGYTVSPRTIDDDIFAMRNDLSLGYEAPIVYDRYKGGYYYSNPKYSIDKLPINDDEMNALSFASALLQQFKNVEVFNKFAGAVDKISNAVKISKINQLQDVLPFIDFEKNPVIKGNEHLDNLINAISKKTVVSFNYKPFYKETSYKHTIHPYLLKEYRNRWYVIGWHNDLNDIRTYGLDRIIGEIKEEKDLIYRHNDFDYKEYFKNTIGLITMPDTPEEVILEFTMPEGNYVLTQPLHETQKTLELTEDILRISLLVNLNYEFRTIVLSFGSQIKILMPEHFRQEIVTELERTIEKNKQDSRT